MGAISRSRFVASFVARPGTHAEINLLCANGCCYFERYRQQNWLQKWFEIMGVGTKLATKRVRDHVQAGNMNCLWLFGTP